MVISVTLEEYHELIKPKSKRKAAKYAATEAQEQIALLDWIAKVEPREGRLGRLFHVPNGEYRDKATGAKLQRMGVRPGVPDLWLVERSRGYVGCVIELKAAGGSTSDAQRAWLDHLCDQGWYAVTCYGWIAAARRLCWYLDQDEAFMGIDKL